MRSWPAFALCIALAIPLAGCRRGGEEPEEAAEPERTGLIVPDTTINRDLNARLDIDPRLSDPGIQLEAHAVDGEVTLLGVVPSRYELGIALEVARSTPGVHQVWLDSVQVISEGDEPIVADTTTGAADTP